MAQKRGQLPYMTINGQNIFKSQIQERLIAITKKQIQAGLLFKRNGKTKITAVFVTIDENGDCERMKCTIEHGCLIGNIRKA